MPNYCKFPKLSRLKDCELYLERPFDKRRVDDPNPAMRAVWGKTEGRTGKIAINLHVKVSREDN